MKREYSTPVMKVEVFEASESVAACYKIYCNVPGNLWNKGVLYEETNGKSGLQTGRGGDTQRAQGWGCEEWHKGVIRDEPPTANGYWKYNGEVLDVFCWKEDLGSTYDWHATLIDKVQWERNPNAS